VEAPSFSSANADGTGNGFSHGAPGLYKALFYYPVFPARLNRPLKNSDFASFVSGHDFSQDCASDARCYNLHIMPFRDRLAKWPRIQHAYDLGIGWWAVLVAGWGLLSFADTLVSRLGSTAFQARWASWWVHPIWGWKTFLVGVCVITTCVIFEASYRKARRHEQTHRKELAEELEKKDRAFSQMVANKDADYTAIVRMKDGDLLALKQETDAALKAKDAEIDRLTHEPDINVRIMAVFWDHARDMHGNAFLDDSCFFVKLKLINRNDVPCTVDKFWMMDKSVTSFQRKFPGFNVYGVLAHSSMYGGPDTKETDAGKETRIAPIMVAAHNPLKRGCAQEGWVQFHAMSVAQPPEGKDFPGFWVWKQFTVVIEDSLGHEHERTNEWMAVIPAAFTPQ
jgi:hypothetical protein